MITVDYPVGGITCRLLLNANALFSIYDRFGQDGDMLEPISGNDKKAFDNLCVFLSLLSEQGELWRRYQGYAAARMPSADWFRINLDPLDVIAAKAAVRSAVMAGFRREEQDTFTADPFLEEIEKKKDAG